MMKERSRQKWTVTRWTIAFLFAASCAEPAPSTETDPSINSSPTPILRSYLGEPKPLPTLSPERVKITEEDLEEDEFYRKICAVSREEVPEATGQLTWPTYGPLFQYFRYYPDPPLENESAEDFLPQLAHGGIDISPSRGTPVFAADGGIVIHRQVLSWGLGKHIAIEHGGRVTIYGHLDRMLVSEGQRVEQTELIGEVGSTGQSTGAHLHFEVIEKSEKGCEFVNPMHLLP